MRKTVVFANICTSSKFNNTAMLVTCNQACRLVVFYCSVQWRHIVAPLNRLFFICKKKVTAFSAVHHFNWHSLKYVNKQFHERYRRNIYLHISIYPRLPYMYSIQFTQEYCGPLIINRNYLPLNLINVMSILLSSFSLSILIRTLL